MTGGIRGLRGRRLRRIGTGPREGSGAASAQESASPHERAPRLLGRREFIGRSALALSATLVSPGVALARPGADARPRLIFVILRGALDGLAAVPPYGDPDYVGLRRELALPPPGAASGVLQLDGLFGLNPALDFLHQSFTGRELLVFHAVATPYRERSHFDGQNVLESGAVRAHALQTGWLNRALASKAAGMVARHELGVAIDQNIPLVLRGPAPVTSWSPSKLAALDEDTLQRIADLYRADPLLRNRLADALAADAIADSDAVVASNPLPVQGMGNTDRTDNTGGAGSTDADPGKSLLARRGRPSGRYMEIVKAAAGFLSSEEGPQVAVFDTVGWDTHANEGSAEGQLAVRLAALDAALRTLKGELGPAWQHTAILVATEFGRTVEVNGTRGTDHGTAAAAFLLGGAVRGGRVIADWPGLSRGSLYEGRDLRPTLDLRSVIKGVLAEHLLVRPRVLTESVFPNSSHVGPMAGLIRTRI